MVTYDELNKEFTSIISKMKELKDTLEQEEDFWRCNLDELLEILERILARLELRYMSGEIDVKEWEYTGTVLTLGLDSMKNMTTASARSCPEPDLPNLVLKERIEEAQLDGTDKSSVAETYVKRGTEVPDFSEETKDRNLENLKKSHLRSQSRGKAKKRSVRNRIETKDRFASGAHCRNPWNTKCKNTDIELSIYYKSEFLPICHECWQEISTRNLEWSST